MSDLFEGLEVRASLPKETSIDFKALHSMPLEAAYDCNDGKNTPFYKLEKRPISDEMYMTHKQSYF